ncbi:hypothetical protein ABN028_23500 [Actinopolymorpha sp. B17G11]|uniref:hypothetical protein n=1 Tax=Actinopolymorpha sp. B17G11 TaxID=3160861 RepID=UPI0032E3BA01
MLRRRGVCIAMAAMVVLLVGVAAGCGVQDDTSSASADAPRRAVDERPLQQAHKLLARWDKAVAASGGRRFVPVGDLTGTSGEWGDQKPKVFDKITSGCVTVAAPGSLPTTTHPVTEIRWTGGSQRVPRLSATKTLELLATAARANLRPCEPLEVTGAHAVTAQIQTSRGDATVPAWEYQLAGTAARFTRPALDPTPDVTVSPPGWTERKRPGGPSTEAASIAVSDTRLKVFFTGSPGGADQPCGADYTADAVESTTAVVVIVVEDRAPDPPKGVACTAVGAYRTATAQLDEPLKGRTVLDAVRGEPVPVAIHP